MLSSSTQQLVRFSLFPSSCSLTLHAARIRLESFIRSRSEWCISRQRVWGVPIPALYHIATDRAVLDSTTLTHIISVLEEKGVAHWWDGPVADFVPPSLLDSDSSVPVDQLWKKGTDTMDVWFDSGTSWSMLPEMGVGKDTENRQFHSDVCLEGSDQHRGWFQSQLLTAVSCAPTGSLPASPYGTLITHGMVLDEAGKKMSKSLGNVVSPLTIVHGGEVGGLFHSYFIPLPTETCRTRRRIPFMGPIFFGCGPRPSTMRMTCLLGPPCLRRPRNR